MWEYQWNVICVSSDRCTLQHTVTAALPVGIPLKHRLHRATQAEGGRWEPHCSLYLWPTCQHILNSLILLFSGWSWKHKRYKQKVFPHILPKQVFFLSLKVELFKPKLCFSESHITDANDALTPGSDEQIPVKASRSRPCFCFRVRAKASAAGNLPTVFRCTTSVQWL